MIATGELVRLEVRPTRKTKVTLARHKPVWLLAINPGVSFFYRVEMNGKMQACTEDPMKAREVFRECCRWAVKA